jgi:glucan phosphoethanolaminetransferase (alkaline phosphatase superfamily)
MIVIVTVIFWSLSFLADDNPYLSNEIALWIYFIAISPVVFLFTLSVKKYPRFTLAALFVFLLLAGVTYSFYNYSKYGDSIAYKAFLLLAHAVTVLYFFANATKTLSKENVVFEYDSANDSPNKSNSRKLARRRNRREHSWAKNSTRIKSGQYRG